MYFISKHIRYTEEDYQRYNDRYCIGEKYDKIVSETGSLRR